MFSLYVGIILLATFIVFIWICSAIFFEFIGSMSKKFLEPFKEQKNNRDKGGK